MTLTELDDRRAATAEVERQRGLPRRGPSRRQFLVGGAATAAGTMLSYKLGRAAGTPRIAIVGGGIAGLSAALTLADAGYASTIYEAQPNRIGGRMMSDRPLQPACGGCHTVGRQVSATWADSQYTDVFGELIDSDHATIHALADRFGLGMTDLVAAHPAGSTDSYYFFDQRYSAAQAQSDFDAIYRALRDDVNASGYPTTWDSSRPGGRALDNMSIYDWIESRIPGGHNSPFGMLLDVAYAIEYGADCQDQSALNLVYLLGYSPRTFSIFGESDEAYRLTGGIELLPMAIAEHLGPDAIRLGWYMESIVQEADGTYTLTFDSGRTETVRADIVVMTIPFAVLKDIDYAHAGFDQLKDFTIQTLGAGKNGKHHIQFNNRYWNNQGPWGIGNGNAYSDTGFQAAWDTTRGQAGASGILVCYTGGSVTEQLALRHPYGNMDKSGVRTDTEDFLSQLEPVFPGISAQWNGRAAGSVAHLNPFWKCSYSYWRVGQVSTIAGYERVRQGNVFWAGEHCSLDYQGFMEGAASEGVRAGNEILASLRGGRNR